MRILLTLTVLCCVLSVQAQRTMKDSLQYYNERLGSLYNRVWDSLKLNDSARYYQREIKRAHARSKNYSAATFFFGVESADYKSFNAAIGKDGFAPLKGPQWQLGGGYSHQGYDRVIFDLNYLVTDLGQTTGNATSSISTNTFETLDVQVGYALLNASRITVYPYVGLTGRFSTLDYSTQDTVNPGYNSIASLLQNGRRVHTTAVNFGYQAGVGIDWIVSYNEKTRGGIILFGKFGTDGVFGSQTYLVSDVDYDPGIRYGAWVAQIGVKIFNRYR